MRFTNITPESIVKSKQFNSTTLYYIAPVEAFPDLHYPDAIGYTISLEFIGDHISASCCYVTVSPYKADDETDAVYDYDFNEYELTLGEKQRLIDMVSDKLDNNNKVFFFDDYMED